MACPKKWLYPSWDTPRYGMRLRAEFVPMGATEGVMKDLYFKIFPKGTCSIAGCILGYPVLEHFGHRVEKRAHVFDALDVMLPRLEQVRKVEYELAMSRYLSESGTTPCYSLLEGREKMRFAREHAASLDCFAKVRKDCIAQRLAAVAVADTSDVILQPGDEAVVPAVWTQNVPDSDFLAQP